MLFERKKNTQGVRFLTKYQTDAWKMATVWHLRDTIRQSPVVVWRRIPGASGRCYYVTLRCKPTDSYAMWPKIDVLNLFFSSIFFLFPECVILEIGISSDIIRWWADCVGVYFLLIFFFSNHIMRPNIWFAKEKKTLTECFICAWAFKMSNLKKSRYIYIHEHEHVNLLEYLIYWVLFIVQETNLVKYNCRQIQFCNECVS